jgi:hypothetical protein
MICSLISINATSQTKAVILDSITANKVVKDLVRYDVTRLELKNCNKRDSLSQVRIKVLRDASNILEQAYNEKEAENNVNKRIIELQEKQIVKEKRKNTFYKVTTALGVLTSILLLVSK